MRSWLPNKAAALLLSIAVGASAAGAEVGAVYNEGLRRFKAGQWAEALETFKRVKAAVPGYREYMRRGAVEEGLATLSSTRTAMEQFFLDNRTYDGAPDPPDTKEFVITVVDDADSYTLTATGSGRVAGFVYTLDESGARTSAGPWGSGNCWIGRKGESCGGGS